MEQNIIYKLRTDMSSVDMYVEKYWKSIDFHKSMDDYDILYYIFLYKSSKINFILDLFINGKINININKIYSNGDCLLNISDNKSLKFLLNNHLQNKINLKIDIFNNMHVHFIQNICEKGDIENIKLFSKLVDNLSYYILKPNYCKETALHVACYNNPEILEYMLNYINTDLNLYNNWSEGLLHISCYHKNPKMLDLLLKKFNNFDVNKKAFDGKTAIHYACSRNRLDNINLLIKYNGNIDLDIKDNRFCKAIDYLIDHEYIKTFKKIRKYSKPKAGIYCAEIYKLLIKN